MSTHTQNDVEQIVWHELGEARALAFPRMNQYFETLGKEVDASVTHARRDFSGEIRVPNTEFSVVFVFRTPDLPRNLMSGFLLGIARMKLSNSYRNTFV